MMFEGGGLLYSGRAPRRFAATREGNLFANFTGSGI
jgi:hypothetical protein